MEAGSAFDGVAFVDEGAASFSDDVVDFVDRRDVFADDGFVDQRHSVSAGCSSGV